MVLVSLFACSYREAAKPSLGLVSDTTPRKISIHKVLDGASTDPLGYIHKYEWEPKVGKILSYYLVYDSLGQLMGQVRQDGLTQVFGKKEHQILGYYNLKQATIYILTAPSTIQITPEPRDFELGQAPQYADAEFHSLPISSLSESKAATPELPGEVTPPSETPESPSEAAPTETTPEEPTKSQEEEWPDSNEGWTE